NSPGSSSYAWRRTARTPRAVNRGNRWNARSSERSEAQKRRRDPLLCYPPGCVVIASRAARMKAGRLDGGIMISAIRRAHVIDVVDVHRSFSRTTGGAWSEPKE